MSNGVTITDDKPNALSLVDGMQNLATGLGTAKDKSIHNQWNHTGRNNDHVTLSARYREDWLSQKTVDIVPNDMTRDWREFNSEDATEADDEFEVADLFRDAYKRARLYGTSFIVLDIDDKRNPDKPLNIAKLKAGCIKSMRVVDRTRIVATSDIDFNPMSLTYGIPEYYQFAGMTDRIHGSRLIRFEGTQLPIFEKMRNLWYSDSILIPLMEAFDDFHSIQGSTVQMAAEASVDVISVEGLSEMLVNDKTSAAMMQRFLDWKNLKSSFGVSILDTTEVYEQKKMQLNGVTDLLWKQLEVVASMVGIPATRFLCSSPSGLGSSGHSDVVNYSESLIQKQNMIFKPRLKRIDELLAIHFGMDKKEFKYNFKCVFPESKGEEADRMNTTSLSLSALADSGIISRESALEEAIKKGIISKDAKVGEDPNKQVTTGTQTKSVNQANKAKPSK